MKKLFFAIALLLGGMASYQPAFAEPAPQVCNYDRPCIWTGSIQTGRGYSLYVSVYYGKDGKSVLASFKDKDGNDQVCYCYKANSGNKWYFEFDGMTLYFEPKGL